jgi:outer membrane receptor protein involved in Fe transport
VLPAVVATFELADDLLLRAAWTSSIGRPNYEQVAPISSLERDGADATRSIGNPDLEAFESANADLSIEYYLGQRKGCSPLRCSRKTSRTSSSVAARR